MVLSARHVIAAAILASLPGYAQTHVGQSGERVRTNYYEAEITATGSLDFYSLTGVRLISGLPLFRARYSCAGSYLSLTGDTPSLPLIIVQGDSIIVRSQQTVGPLALVTSYALARSSPYVECRIRLTYEQDIDSVFLEGLEGDVWPESARVVGRDQKFDPPGRRVPETVIDKWTTRAAEFGRGLTSVCFPGEDDLAGLRVRWTGSHWRLSYDLDRVGDHPFFRNYRPARPMASVDTASALKRFAGESRAAFFRFAVGREQRVLRKEHQPDGYEATLVITEHADCEGPATTRAIAYGRSDADAPIPGRGILGNGLTWTKSVFRWSTTGSRYANLGYSALDDSEFKQTIDQIHARGVEIALHSPTALPDSANRVAAALRDLSDWYGSRVWIDHGMDVNWEALSTFGAYPESLTWFIVDTLRAYGFSYAWLALDAQAVVPTWGGNMFVPQAPDFYPPVLWPLPVRDDRTGLPPLYLWETWVINEDRQRDWLLGKSGIDWLLSGRGVEIVHLYFGSQDTFIGRPNPTTATWLVRHGQPPNLTWETDATVDRYFQQLAERQRTGRLRVVTLSDFADYLLLGDSIELQAIGSNEFLLINHAHRPVPGFALATLAEGVRRIAVDGSQIRSMKKIGKDLLFWFDVPADTLLHLQLQAQDPLYVENLPVLSSRGNEVFWQVAHSGSVSVNIYSASGRLVRSLYQGKCAQGTYSRVWDGRDSRGVDVPAGVYITHLQCGDGSAAGKVVKTK